LTPPDRRHFEPPVLEDTNPDPDVVEVGLTASPAEVRFRRGGTTEVWAYNERMPGPTIEAEVGDRLIVHFCNELPPASEAEGAGATTIHWHGVENVAPMDGSNISQPLVDPGECFDYDFPLLRAATYWYHAHIESNVQVEHGLHGALVVRDPAEDKALGLPTKDTVVVLDDVLLDDHGDIAPPLPDDGIERAKTLLDGREGNTLLVNGRAPQTVNVRIGEPQRWRLVNVANARFMRLSFPTNAWRIGGDAGLIAHPEEISPIPQVPDPEEPGQTMSDPDPDKGLLLTPGERAEVLFTATGKPGDVIEVKWHDFPRGRHAPFRRDDGTIGLADDENDGRHAPETLVRLRLIGKPRGTEPTPPETLRPVDPIDTSDAKTLHATFGHGAPTPDGDVTFFAQQVDGSPRPFDAVTPADAQDVTVGDTAIWEITNPSGADHPFHAHGFFFQPLEVEFVDMDNPENNRVVPFTNVEFKDNIRLPARPGAAMRSRTILRVAVSFDDTGREGLTEAFGKSPSPGHSGGWVFHCHILEHADHGMMSFVEVRNE
jgi:FtsP/CotA-like multicopper oxidase with cupredoxin domain